MAQVELSVIEQSGVEVIVLDAPGAQVAIGPTLSTATPQPVGLTGAAGDSSSAARANHVHAHGNQTGSSLHALASGSGAGFMSAAQFNLLDGATDADTASTLVKRDASGNFAANVITAALSGNAATASAWATGRTITLTGDVTGVSAEWTGSGNISFATSIAAGTPRQLLQTDAAGTGVEWASNIDVPGTLDVTGAATFDSAVTIQGDLIVNGTTTTIDSSTLAVEDKNIEIGKVAVPTNATANGGGITLKGAVDKTITWLDATSAWTFSEHVDLATGKTYKINGADVLSATTLGSAVVNSSLTGVGTLTSGALGTGFTTVATARGGTGQTTYSNGQLLIGKTDGTLAKATLTQGVATTITNGDGSVTIDLPTGVATPGTYRSVTVDTYGRVTQGTSPTTLSGYGITDALSNSTTSTQNGYFGDIYLYDDATPSHYLQITNSANLTAARSLSINVNDANRTVSLSGNLTVPSAATISGTNTGDQTITLTGAVTGTGTGSFATTFGSGDFGSLNISTTGEAGLLGIIRSNTSYNGELVTGSEDGLYWTSGVGLRISTNGINCGNFRRRSSNGQIFGFYRDTTAVGNISVSTTATAYNTSSDYRLKENVTLISDAIDRLKQLSPKRFNFISAPDTTVDGFLAHEAQQVVPEAVTGQKDEVDSEGAPVYQGMDQSKIVPLLTAALQEAIARIEALEAAAS